MSLPEVVLWQILRRQPDGVKFRRQHPFGVYVLDFYCAERKIAVEIDGLAHDMGIRPDRDAVRDSWLRQHGVDVIRIPAREVLAEPVEVAGRLVRYAHAAPSGSDPGPSR